MTINCKGKLIDLRTPKVMGILNLTPDSFYDGGKFGSQAESLRHVEKMLADGADFIDIGGYSSKPGAEDISQDEELKRVIPVIDDILKHFPEAILSIDTFRSKIAEECVTHGAAIINDISAGNLDEAMFETVAKLQVPYIMMHMRGTPQTMKTLTDYDDIVKEMLFYFSEKISKARSLRINDLIIDPGFGFAKTLGQNYEIMQKLELFSMPELPVLVGVSRKSMVYKPLNSNAASALNGTTALNAIALTKGAKILRVHDVKEAVEAVKLFNLTSDS
ncbi:MAG: dihydropteroate synthase [Flavobacterium sp.]|nr:MAG: dihydropteroate synthase [Flavobacterium sp.]